MKFTREIPSALMIRNIADGEIRIGETTYRNTIALTTEKVFDDWQDVVVTSLSVEHFAPVLETGPELIVLGTGKRNLFAPKTLIFALARQGIGLEVMDTSAAARTFNVLAGEGRKVAAVLYL